MGMYIHSIISVYEKIWKVGRTITKRGFHIQMATSRSSLIVLNPIVRNIKEGIDIETLCKLHLLSISSSPEIQTLVATTQ